MDTDPSPPYYAFLLRLWPAEAAEQRVWRASLENPHTGERFAFASLDQLHAFLREQLAARASDQPVS